MGMDPSNPHHKVMVTNSSSLEDMLMINNCSSKPQQQSEKKASSSVLARPTQPDLKCPRCDSSNTKFCYYNNYSLTQPRYFCKGCRRYWTQGGSLRNVPVGGGCRKSNKRPSPSSSSSTSSCTSSKKTLSQDHQIFTINSNPSSLPPLSYDSNDLTLAFSRVLHKQQQQPTSTSTTMQLGFDHHHHDQVLLGNPTAKTTINVSTLGSPDTSNENNNNNNNGSSFLDALRSGFLETQSGFQNFQYGFGNCNVGDHLDNQNGNGSGNAGGIDHLPYQEITSTTTTTTRTEDYFGNSIKGERDHGAAADQSKVFMNFPWHQFSTPNGDGGNINVDSSVSASASGRDQLYWNNGFGSSWHGLVNSL